MGICADDKLEPVDPCSEIYIGELDEESVGSYITGSSPEECEIDYDKYRVIANEYPESAELSVYGDNVTIRFISIEEADDFTLGWGVPLLVSEDGGGFNSVVSSRVIKVSIY